MSRPGLFRSLRELFRELRTFGDPALDNLKIQARALQRQLDELEAMRAARAKHEEALALMQVQNTVQNLQQLDKIVQKSELMIAAAVEKAGAQTDQKVKMLLQQRAQEVVSKLDLAKALSMDASPERIVADAMKQAASQLQADGGHALNLAQPNLQPQLPDTLSQGSQPPSSPTAVSNATSPLSQHQQKRQLHHCCLHSRAQHTCSNRHGLAAS